MRMIIATAVILGAVVAGWLAAINIGDDAAAGPPPTRYIVQFDPAEIEDVDSTVADFEATYAVQADIVYYHSIQGFSAVMSGDTANAIAQDGRVLQVEQNTTYEQAQWGDANCDGAADFRDILDVLSYMAGLPLREDIGCKPGGYSTQGWPMWR